jgi:4-diphosphocytidyl-2-C-methyl-D-erythritol kinase
LAGRPVRFEKLAELGAALGADVPFFLYGGTALGIGRGTELYPLPDLPTETALVVASGIHVSTAEAYGKLDRTVPSRVAPASSNSLTSSPESLILGEFQSVAWALNGTGFDQIPLKNDFEQVVFAAHPELAALVRKLRRSGARPALMTGSGSALFGLFPTGDEARAAAGHFAAGTTHVVRFLSRRQYRSRWNRALQAIKTSGIN